MSKKDENSFLLILLGLFLLSRLKLGFGFGSIMDQGEFESALGKGADFETRLKGVRVTVLPGATGDIYVTTSGDVPETKERRPLSEIIGLSYPVNYAILSNNTLALQIPKVCNLIETITPGGYGKTQRICTELHIIVTNDQYQISKA